MGRRTERKSEQMGQQRERAGPRPGLLPCVSRARVSARMGGSLAAHALHGGTAGFHMEMQLINTNIQ